MKHNKIEPVILQNCLPVYPEQIHTSMTSPNRFTQYAVIFHVFVHIFQGIMRVAGERKAEKSKQIEKTMFVKMYAQCALLN